MKTNFKGLLQFVLTISLVVLTTAQHNYRSQRKRSAHRSQQDDEPREQGRTLGFIQPLLGLGLSAIARPFLGYDVPFVPENRPSSGSGSGSGSELPQSDPYYGYGNYGGYAPNFYTGYNYYGGYPFYRPLFPFYNAYRPQVYPAHYGGYVQNNGGFAGQRPAYTNPRPKPIAQPAAVGQQPAAYPAVSPANPTPGGATSPAANSAQAAQIANLLGQLLGQQLRPLINQGAAAPAHDEPGIAPINYHDKSFRNPYYRG